MNVAPPLTPMEQAILGGNFGIKPHPDGKPWPKCCGKPGDDSDLFGGCKCFVRKPPDKESRLDRVLAGDPSMKFPSGFRPTSEEEYQKIVAETKQCIAENGRFFCVHRSTDDGFHRECAGWAAKFHPTTENLDGTR